MKHLQGTKEKRETGRTNASAVPIIYFDGDFRTWDGVISGALLNKAILKQLA